MVEIDNLPQEWHTIAARHRYWKLDDRDAGDKMNSTIEAPFIFKKHRYDLSDEGNSKLIIKEMDWDENDWPVVKLYE